MCNRVILDNSMVETQFRLFLYISLFAHIALAFWCAVYYNKNVNQTAICRAYLEG